MGGRCASGGRFFSGGNRGERRTLSGRPGFQGGELVTAEYAIHQLDQVIESGAKDFINDKRTHLALDSPFLSKPKSHAMIEL